MAISSAQDVRLLIRDLPRVADDTYIGDGSATVFNLPHENITSASAYVPGSNGQWSATGATFNTSGYVEFSDTISANTAFRTRYVHSVFSDEEIDHRLSAGSLNDVAILFVRELMFDGLKRAKWVAPDGSEYDDTKAMDLLDKLYKTLKTEQGEDAIAQGGAVYGWSVTQEE